MCEKNYLEIKKNIIDKFLNPGYLNVSVDDMSLVIKDIQSRLPFEICFYEKDNELIIDLGDKVIIHINIEFDNILNSKYHLTKFK